MDHGATPPEPVHLSGEHREAVVREPQGFTYVVDTCIAGLKDAFANHNHRQRAKDLLRTRTSGLNEGIASFVEDVLRLSAQIEPQATEEKKLRVLMRGLKS